MTKAFRKITDDLGYHWVWSEARGKVYCIEAEQELRKKYNQNPTPENRQEWQDNGYYADTFKEALEILIEGGYIS